MLYSYNYLALSLHLNLTHNFAHVQRSRLDLTPTDLSPTFTPMSISLYSLRRLPRCHPPVTSNVDALNALSTRPDMSTKPRTSLENTKRGMVAQNLCEFNFGLSSFLINLMLPRALKNPLLDPVAPRLPLGTVEINRQSPVGRSRSFSRDMTVLDVPANQLHVQANVEQQAGYLDDGMNQDLIFGSDWYDPEDLDGSGEVQGEGAGEDGVADAPRLRSRTPEASNTRGEDAGLGELHGNLILTIMTT